MFYTCVNCTAKHTFCLKSWCPFWYSTCGIWRIFSRTLTHFSRQSPAFFLQSLNLSSMKSTDTKQFDISSRRACGHGVRSISKATQQKPNISFLGTLSLNILQSLMINENILVIFEYIFGIFVIIKSHWPSNRSSISVPFIIKFSFFFKYWAWVLFDPCFTQ